jgi:hypothetical protein
MICQIASNLRGTLGAFEPVNDERSKTTLVQSGEEGKRNRKVLNYESNQIRLGLRFHVRSPMAEAHDGSGSARGDGPAQRRARENNSSKNRIFTEKRVLYEYAQLCIFMLCRSCHAIPRFAIWSAART